MRALPGCLLVLSLTGCSWIHSPTSTTASRHTAPNYDTGALTGRKTAAQPQPAKLYKSAEELVGKPFRDLGEAYGSVCQVNLQDPPPSIAAARKDMQMRAARMKGNAVLLHNCETVRAVAGCYQQTVCQGTALKVTQ
ncbi:Rcs stress response system protein RcsF [Martelella alba]|uniref:Rcs stress response system protein RcsF n=1 Tax=Martelella alba TaxID=2590451 RepID=A0ABY2SN64_9HYPH|nr:Rcs stress response system protein RcsF [Martelella alba]TKI05883.1 Rcs stress response system protein RcsF [Martelella alba]